jgi:hypothetical protein
VSSSDRFYHWGALLALTDYLEDAKGNDKPEATMPKPAR